MSSVDTDKPIPAKQIKTLSEGITSEDLSDLNISQARALRKQFSKDSLTEHLQILWTRLDKVHELNVDEINDVIQTEGFKSTMKEG